MKTILDSSTRNAIIERIKTLDANSTPLWGKMSVYQMIQHCAIWDERVLNDVKIKQSFLGKVFGKIALKKVLTDEKPLGKNSPTSPSYRMTGSGDVESAKARWIDLMQGYASYTKPEYMHDFFGKMTREQLGQLGYKHVDHHLRQFGK